MTTPTEMLRRAVARDPARPRMTWFDGISGERVELSGATLANWVNKTAHLMIDELGVAPGDQVAIDLPRHWLTAVWWLAVDAVGATPVVGAAPTAPLAVIGPPIGPLPPNDEVVAVSLLPMGAPFAAPPPPPARDYSLEVRVQADQFTPTSPGDHEAGQRAHQWAADWQLNESDRFLAVGPLSHDDDLGRSLLAPLAVGASVVWVRNLPDPTGVQHLAAERVTVGLGPPLAGTLSSAEIRWVGQPSVS